MANPIITLSIPTRGRNELIDITAQVQRAVTDSSVRGGVAIVFIPHTTAAVTINENADPDVRHDLLRKLEQLVPHHETFYRHAEGNSDAHVKASMLGHSVTVLIDNGRLVLGTWQAVYFAEFDGPRQRQALVRIVSA